MNVTTPHIIANESKPVYFAVSKKKLIVLSLCTFGIYEIYWFYKNWEAVKERTGQDIMPFWRAIFAVLFCHSLFKSVKQSADSYGILPGISPGWLTFGYIAILLTWRLPDPVWLISVLTFLPLLPVQGAINNINLKTDPNADLNDRFTGKNIPLIILGSLWWILVTGAMVGPSIEVIPGAQVPQRFTSKIKALGLLEEGERIQFFYSNAFINIENGFCLLTDRKVVIYSKQFTQPAILVPFPLIKDIDAQFDESFWTDSQIILTLADDTYVSFPVSSEGGGDKRFYEALRASWERNRQSENK